MSDTLNVSDPKMQTKISFGFFHDFRRIVFTYFVLLRKIHRKSLVFGGQEQFPADFPNPLMGPSSPSRYASAVRAQCPARAFGLQLLLWRLGSTFKNYNQESRQFLLTHRLFMVGSF